MIGDNGTQQDRGVRDAQLESTKMAAKQKNMRTTDVIERTFAALTLLAVCSAAVADIELPALFSDGMVLQQQMPVKVWGWANNGERVVVQFRGQRHVTVAEDERWSVTLNPMDAGGPDRLEVSGFNQVLVEDVKVGEVWLAGGQSNMAWRLARTTHTEESLAGVENLELHVFSVKERSVDSPRHDVEGTWYGPDARAMANASAVAFLFGREIFETQGVPVGIVLSYKGGTRAVNWTSREVLAQNPDAAGHYRYYQKLVEAFPAAHDEWEAAGRESSPPRSPARRLPSGYFNGMISGLIPFTLRGVIWYQGETDSWNAEQYTRMFPDLISDWRSRWGQGDFPFFYVQLAGFNGKDGVDVNYAHLRDIQMKTLDMLPNLGMAVAIDAGDETDIHPRDKRSIAHRLALLARKRVYGEKVIDTGPAPQHISFQDGQAVVQFDTGDLVVDGKALRGFELADESGRFEAALASLDGDLVVVRSSKVADPRYLRYAFSGFPNSNLYNSAGLPASPFRTDNFPRGEGAVRQIPE
jgi:sialate O-acetylesterase